MFFVKDFTHKIHLSPSYLGPQIQSLIQDYLYRTVEGSCTESGYVIAVLEIDDVSEGIILLDGLISFTVKYKALVLKTYKGEVLEAVVVESTRMGIFASAGPLTIFISNHRIPPDILELNIGKETILRLKIIGTRIDYGKIYAVGTLEDEYLGVVS
ncbi:DNA-directed RNA polymerase II subunit RPB7 [Nosema bombycis CQ1]|jgi:DNA-directed RNA polymerase II subunit RPB7|uniref:DNA-directed RNA polymerase II subunit RPB7 n=1 Tax=Nosema bombycis (strain CQ1 / CVCC 102059) TaxID=578461 RepID=R0MM81_NOSB1|nr:DNA-directed RNA polymerase II subunit RPB7 [Nosema bombycis CQ1]EOB15325.1 DNA-directed RNA polymerase II subunit RPB7 [Nosema bombycis CQ1]|eukprot:EOB15010.1 DNA-directed RNA polymerase II subunit RPB7 [Nosema bombycis CQ1]